MNLPFTSEQFFDLFGAYNAAIWPAQIVAYLLSLVAMALVLRENRLSGKIISGILGLFWIWMGVVYHILYFREINPAALVFGIGFVIQGLVFIVVGVILGKLAFRFDTKPIPLVGGLFILYAMAVYPFLSVSFGHAYPKVPMFGVAPCPTTIFTFGILLWAAKPVRFHLLVIPLLWSIVGLGAAMNLRVPQDYGLVIAGIIGTILILVHNRHTKNSVQQ